MSSPLSAAGLVLDIAGAVVLASAFAFKTPRHIEAEAGTYFGFNAPLLLSLAKQTADAWTGAGLLVLGFAAQFESALGSRALSLRITLPVAIALALGAFAGLHLWLRPWNVRRVIGRFLASQHQSGRLDGWQAAIIWFSRACGREIQAGERPADLGRWLLGERRWSNLTAGVDLPADLREPYREDQT
jgi:hypothetical protein